MEPSRLDIATKALADTRVHLAALPESAQVRELRAQIDALAVSAQMASTEHDAGEVLRAVLTLRLEVVALARGLRALRRA